MFWFTAFWIMATYAAWTTAIAFGLAVIIGWQLDIKWRFWKPKPRKATKQEELMDQLWDEMMKKMDL